MKKLISIIVLILICGAWFLPYCFGAKDHPVRVLSEKELALLTIQASFDTASYPSLLSGEIYNNNDNIYVTEIAVQFGEEGVYVEKIDINPKSKASFNIYYTGSNSADSWQLREAKGYAI